jgi:hypothetical protein
VTVTAAAGTGTLTRVELLVDGVVVASDFAAPWSFVWDSTEVANGSHSLAARVYNTAGNVGISAEVPLAVNNMLPALPPAIALAFAGLERDRVGKGALSPDGDLDAAFLLTLVPGSGARTMTQLELRRHSLFGVWDTVPSSFFWTLGVAGSLDGPLLNDGGGDVNFTLADGGSVVLFAADFVRFFGSGASFSITATFSDGSTASAATTIP